MTGKAEKWIISYLSSRRNVDWPEFVMDLSARFKDERGVNSVEKFNKLEQTDTIESYLDEFEELKSDVLETHHSLPEEYLLDSFIGGMKPGIKPFVKAFKPATLAAAVEFARLQEDALAATQKVTKPTSSFPYKPLQAVPLNSNKPPLLPTPPIKPNNQLSLTKFNPKTYKNPRYIPADVRAEKIAKGLCYYCDQPYDRNHKCQFKEPQLFTVEIAKTEGKSEISEGEEDSE